jgi:hypothetical protein
MKRRKSCHTDSAGAMAFSVGLTIAVLIAFAISQPL